MPRFGLALLFLLAAFAAQRASASPCSVDADCKLRRVCKQGACVAPSCGRDRDCPGDQICKAGACAMPTSEDLGGAAPAALERPAPAAASTPPPSKNACQADSDCPRRRYCNDGKCGPKRKAPPAPEAEAAPAAAPEPAAPAKPEHTAPAKPEHAAPAKPEHTAPAKPEHAAPAKPEHAAPAKPAPALDWPTAIPPPPAADSAAAAAAPSPKNACMADSDCPRHRYCIEGQCGRKGKKPAAADATPAAAPAPAPAAAPAAAPVTKASGPAACGTDKDCPGEQVCNDGNCADPHAASAAPPPPPPSATGPGGGCGTDKDCPGDLVCDEGKCLQPPSAAARAPAARPSATPAAAVSARAAASPPKAGCKADTECDGDDVCEAGVCTSPNASKPRFSLASGVVRDAVLKLAWQRGSSPALLQQSEAEAYCRKLNLGGAGWRLPTIDELRSLASAGPPAQAASFDAVREPLWTSSADAEKRWAATLAPFVRSELPETERARARCVR